jgi:mycofactocin system creatininase family protein
VTGLGELTSPEAGARAAAGALLAVPVGSTEQHGPHLPLSTDTDLAEALSARLAAEHQEFPGTLSIGQEALELVLVELARSATVAFARVLLVSTHGGNAAVVRRAERRLRAESRDVRAWQATWRGDAHAGRTETSIQLALDPARVRIDLAEPGNSRPLAELMPAMVARSVHAVSPNGVLGDPAGASADEGGALLDALTANLLAAVAGWWGATDGVERDGAQ